MKIDEKTLEYIQKHLKKQMDKYLNPFPRYYEYNKNTFEKDPRNNQLTLKATAILKKIENR